MIFEKVEIAFAQVTGEGNDDGRFNVAIVVDKKHKKLLVKEREKVWGDAKGKPKQSIDDWITEDEETGKDLFWIGCNADPDNPAHALDYIVGDGDSFTMKDFGIIGAGSKATLEFNMFKTTFKKKPNIGRALIAVQLLDLVPFEGGATPTTLKGKNLSEDGTSKKGKKGKSDKKDKKKKKKKKSKKD